MRPPSYNMFSFLTDPAPWSSPVITDFSESVFAFKAMGTSGEGCLTKSKQVKQHSQ